MSYINFRSHILGIFHVLRTAQSQSRICSSHSRHGVSYAFGARASSCSTGELKLALCFQCMRCSKLEHGRRAHASANHSSSPWIASLDHWRRLQLHVASGILWSWRHCRRCQTWHSCCQFASWFGQSEILVRSWSHPHRLGWVAISLHRFLSRGKYSRWKGTGFREQVDLVRWSLGVGFHQIQLLQRWVRLLVLLTFLSSCDCLK